jgi:hypothetical protein
MTIPSGLFVQRDANSWILGPGPRDSIGSREKPCPIPKETQVTSRRKIQMKTRRSDGTLKELQTIPCGHPGRGDALIEPSAALKGWLKMN